MQEPIVLPAMGLVEEVTLIEWLVEDGQRVGKGDRLLVMEAMKMQSTVYAPIAGRISRRLVSPGQNVETKELLLVIE